ncbi:LAME_0D03730g1_1 [Lachancea meyersii CBS 8951]|uniref:LAME_0D03730g1_1 n=1 Tax=Lachancea meyersii CBS 8951 TaxID=1266667 RepID=A0A1G4J7P5_9SACH|nr:LAME_0D03730g1_1 [Lachancea meyersii CBS 8951]
MGPRSNRQILTQGKNYVAKQAKKYGADEVNFDKDSRLNYLTGFHKRKLERQKKAQEFNKEQARQMKVEERKKMREQRKKDAEEQMRKFKETMKEVGDYVGSDDEFTSDKKEQGQASDQEEDQDAETPWDGFSDNDDSGSKSEHHVKPILKKTQEHYEDDTQVDIEPLEPNENFAYLASRNNVKLEKSAEVLDESIERAAKYAKFLGMDDKPKKKKKFRYLTKSERRQNQKKANMNKRRK